jgi:hypothetical protein
MSFIGKGGIALQPVEKHGYEAITFMPLWLGILHTYSSYSGVGKMIQMFGIWMDIRRICKGQPMHSKKGLKQVVNTLRIIPNYMDFPIYVVK